MSWLSKQIDENGVHVGWTWRFSTNFERNDKREANVENPIKAVECKVSDYLFSVGAKRVGAAVAGFVIGKLTSGAVALFLTAHGVSIDPATLSTYINGAVVSGAVWLHDWLKVKYPNSPLL